MQVSMLIRMNTGNRCGGTLRTWYLPVAGCWRGWSDFGTPSGWLGLLVQTVIGRPVRDVRTHWQGLQYPPGKTPEVKKIKTIKEKFNSKVKNSTFLNVKKQTSRICKNAHTHTKWAVTCNDSED